MTDAEFYSTDLTTSLRAIARSAIKEVSNGRIGVAVSGGSDSMAALHILAGVAAESGVAIHAATVDHGLRPEAADEARQVAKVCVALAVPHEVLRWEHMEISGNLQDQARQARYRLIAGWARERGLSAVVLGHTLDDQAETFLMRLARSSGVDGLARMRSRFNRDGAMFIRPFLDCRRDDLRLYLQSIGQNWIEDPSNDQDRFDRVKARQMLQVLGPLGIDADSLGQVARNMSSARDALCHYTRLEARHCLSVDRGDIVLDWAKAARCPDDIRRRILTWVIQWISGARYAPRRKSLVHLQGALNAGQTHTLSGCLFSVTNDTQNGACFVRVTREFNDIKEHEVPSDQPWDGRWQLDGPHETGLTIRALGPDGLLQCPDWRESGLPRVSLLASPAVWREETLISAPMALNLNGWSAKLVESRDESAAKMIGR